MIGRYIFAFYFVLIGLVDDNICIAQDKLSPKFKNALNARQSTLQKFSVTVGNAALFTATYSNKIKIIHHYPTANIFVGLAPIDILIDVFAHDRNILFVDLVDKPHEESTNHALNTAINRITKAKQFLPELQGDDFTISIKENSVNIYDLDLRGRILQTSLTPSTASQHATAMATFIAGAGNTSEKGLGLAPLSVVTSSDFLNILPDADQYFFTYNIRQQNHSYGVSIENYYGNEALAYDHQLYSNSEFVHVFSAGNIGTSKPTNGVYKNFDRANLSGNFKQAKNVLVVTAVDTTMKRNNLNSRGPAYDGRVKPELTAHGLEGTSDAAALASGMTALLRECFQRNGWGMQSSSMIKAMFIATADDIGRTGIDFDFGYGNINLFQAFKDVRAEHFSSQSLAPGQSKNVAITIPDNVREIRIATSWIDPPASVNATKALVNDVDTYLDYQGEQLKPWVLSHFPHADSLTALSKRKADHLNNVELITIANPIAGTYNLVLSGANLSSSQDVSIAYSFKSNAFAWDYPTENDVIEADAPSTCVWNLPLLETGSISISLNDGAWQLIDAVVEVNESIYNWHTPDTLAVAKLRMEIDGEFFESPQFVISPRSKLKVPFRCEENFALSWKPVPGASRYQIKSLGSNSLYVAKETVDSVVVIETSDLQYFSVQPEIQGKLGLPSEIIDYRDQGAQCYINFFTAYRFDATGNQLEVQLSTYWNVKQVDFYRVSNDIFEHLASQVPVKQTRFAMLDPDLHAGTMRYAVEVTLLDGTKIEADIVDVMVEEKGKAILFPNPAFESVINVLSEGEGQRLNIFDRHGKFVAAFELALFVEQLDVAALTPGLYLFQLEEQGRIIHTGRFLKM